jgi:hypothetical protein
MISEGLESFGLQVIICEIAGAIPNGRSLHFLRNGARVRQDSPRQLHESAGGRPIPKAQMRCSMLTELL